MVIAICGKEPGAIGRLEDILAPLVAEKKSMRLLKFMDMHAFLAYARQVKGDIGIVFFHINPDDELGLETAQDVASQFPSLVMVFITKYVEYARTMMESGPRYFLEEPADPAAVEKLLKEILSKFEREIFFIERKARITYFYGEGKTEYSTQFLSDISKSLPEGFCRCHRDYIVNLKYVRHMDEKFFLLTNESKVPIGATKKAEARMLFSGWLDKEKYF